MGQSEGPRYTSTDIERGQENYRGRGPEGHRPDYLSSFFGAAAARQRLDPLDLCTIVADDEMANECPATRAGVGPLALILASVIAVIVIGVVGVIAAILVRSGWVRWVRGRLLLAAYGASTS